MDCGHLYKVLDPGSAGNTARIFRTVHHAMVAAGIGIMLADTVAPWREAHDAALDAGFYLVCAFFFAEYLARLIAAPGAPGAEHRGKWRSRLAWAGSIGGMADFLGPLPAPLGTVFEPRYASLFGFTCVVTLVPFAPGL